MKSIHCYSPCILGHKNYLNNSDPDAPGSTPAMVSQVYYSNWWRCIVVSFYDNRL
jgi:hypothetical protein